MQTEDTIAAISTAPGHSGIGIIRLSGRDAFEIVEKIFLSTRQKKIRKTPSHRMLYGHIIDPVTRETIDEVLVSVMKAPNTYTREDIVEINSHGGPVPLRRILDLVLNGGARLAEPGEFTQRAFLNGRLDLAQAEAVIDIINALTEQSRKTAVAQLKGALSKNIQLIREELIELAAFVEAYIDFPDEDIETLSLNDMKKRALNIQQTLQKLIESSRYGMILREGLKTAIIGRPNVGKSSLLNALLEHDRAIVTEVPGTTRDVIEEYLNINGIPVRIMDTAGIRDVKDIAEKEGVKRSLKAMEDADLVLLVLDGSEALHETDKELIEKAGTKHAIIVINKSDLPQKIDIGSVIPAKAGIQKKEWIPPAYDLPGQACQARNDAEEFYIVSISAKKESGLDELKDRIAGTVLSGSTEGGTEIVTSKRHVQALEKALVSMDSFIKAVDENTSPEFLSVDLRDALDAIGDIIGITTPDDILNKIFSSFCIGK
ncbi:MAG: tRNA uridine-5-carboxymethylaminomethyl(34) synthesis GTPase MnmE [Nitrospiraceae bacterium]|nr:MAG: tRNA uridine-5-carboxymethylaminomethyl(34) synthesis GTPase MnmE [Nitrospiraceae bacterium]